MQLVQAPTFMYGVQELQELQELPLVLFSDIILVRYPFSDLSGSKVRPAVVVSASHVSQDIFDDGTSYK